MEGAPKILLVDDEPYNLDYLEQELEERELVILTAANGQQALELVAQHNPDMIFLDLMMPVMDGFAVLERLKANQVWASIPVVIISAANDIPSVARAIELGADDFLPKPFNPVLLHARLNAGLEKKRLRDIEQRYLRSLERELEIGRQIQAGFLPRQISQPPGWEIAAFFRAAREVAGDFYDIFNFEEQELALLLGDVTDKGVGSALYMALFRTLLRATLMLESFTGKSPDSEAPALSNVSEAHAVEAPALSNVSEAHAVEAPALSNVSEAHAVEACSSGERLVRAVSFANEYIYQIHDSAMYATLFFGLLNTQTGQLCYLNAGHDLPYILRGNAIRAKLGSTGPLVGALEGASYQTEVVFLQPGDTLVLYSDGITDAQNPAVERFGNGRWRDLIETSSSGSQPIVSHLVDSILDYMGGASQADDISLLTVKRI